LLPQDADLTRSSPTQYNPSSAQPASILLAGLQGQPAPGTPGVPTSQVGVNSGTTYVGADPTYPTSTSANAGPSHPGAYPTYPASGATIDARYHGSDNA